MIRGSGPTAEDLERKKRWDAWIESYFAEIGKAIGPSATKGAHRIFGDFELWYDAMYDGFIHLYVVTKSNMVQLDRNLRVRWDTVEPSQAAAHMLVKVREIQEHPMYVISKRASET
jgi:hypothetical protein